MKKKWFLKELLKAHMQSLNFMSPVFFCFRSGQAGANSYTDYGLTALEYTVHTINVCLVLAFFVFGAATSSSLRSIAAARSADASWSVSHQLLVLIRSSTSSKKAVSERRFFAVLGEVHLHC